MKDKPFQANGLCMLLLVFNNGLLICYGTDWADKPVKTINLPISYTTSYAVSLTYESNGTPLTTMFYRQKTLSNFIVAYRSYGNEAALTDNSYVTIGF